MDCAGDSGCLVPPIKWEPKCSENTKMDKLRKLINDKYSVNLKTYKEFHQWSCDNYSEFWEEVFKFTDIIYSQPYSQVVDKEKNIADIPEWFSGCHLNFTENILRYNDDRVAVFATGEGLGVSKMSFRQLRESVTRYVTALKKMGVQKGDRVVGYIPNCCEALEAMLAVASIGAVWSSTSPDFGVQGVLDRFTQIRPKVIFSVNAVWYNGKIHNHLDKLAQVVQGLPELEKVVVIPFVPDALFDLSNIKNGCALKDFLPNSDEVTELKFEQVPFNHPLFIMYSSGTTGAPKCMVHSVGGTLLKHMEEHVIQSDMDRDDVMLYYTTVGWMMWNWLVSVLAVGAAIVLYDGSPLVPKDTVLWDLIDEIGITFLGTSAKWLAVMEDRGLKPGKTHKLESLKAILSTGSPLKPQSYDYVYTDIKKDLLLASISGGTDIIACFMGQNWTVPVYKGEIQGPNLGCAIETRDEEGKQVFDEAGELVCTKPFPSMPVFFWNDPDGKKYKKAYFEMFPGVWAHGDHCCINSQTGGIVMLGRSDGVLNPNGVRFGSAEIYNVVESFKEIQDSVCVAQRKKDNSEERVVLFVKMATGSNFSGELVTRIKTCIRNELSVRYVPTVVLPIDDIPYTINSKKVEAAVRKAMMGEEVVQKGALANPQCLELYHNIKELQNY
ncbi:AACS [Mytilus edulis]|uniref:Acetoacetyl-CoA synthetase n=1 Tax=Mytilus edulis TaxID=6550 RepID=A0A8S3UY33_MYTED|nr:AACS [Mytilus edulis]